MDRQRAQERRTGRLGGWEEKKLADEVLESTGSRDDGDQNREKDREEKGMGT